MLSKKLKEMMKKEMVVRIITLILISAGLYNCESPCTRKVSQSQINAVNQTQLAAHIEAIDDYLVNNSITAISDPSGIRYTVQTQGTGAKPCLENTVTVKYVGKLLNTGAQFDASTNPVSFPLDNLILGWKIMLPQFQAGSKVTLYIPSGFAYGNSVVGSIPANSNLIFEIELIQ
jgi:FKBP-type peptidyl-prolyl cis-trans isomerase